MDCRRPTPRQVAARAMCLAAVSCRAIIEQDAGIPQAELLHRQVCGWLVNTGVAPELEQTERALLSTPLGELSERVVVNAKWQAESMAVLAWALGCYTLPSANTRCETSEAANSMGFLDRDPKATVLHAPHLRDLSEIESLAHAYDTVTPRRGGVRICQERRRALHWLLGVSAAAT